MSFPKNQLEFEKRFASEVKCREYLYQLRYPGGFVCSKCGGIRHWKQSRDRFTCVQCRFETSLFAGTLFQKTHLPMSLWLRAAWWITNQKQGVNALGLQRALGLGSYRTSWLLLQKLRTAMVLPHRDQLKGEIEVDEAWLGGLSQAGERTRKNKHFILICAEKNGPGIGRIRMKLIPENGGHVLLAGIQELIELGSTVETDGWQGYMCITRHGYKHQRRIMPDRRVEKRDQDLLPRVHRVSSLFKRWVLGTYQGRVDAKYLQRYLDEFVFRFNRRTSGSRGLLFYRLLNNAVHVNSAALPGKHRLMDHHL